jgi:hypothetical protein
VSPSQDFDSSHSATVAMNGSIDTRKSTGTNQIQHLVLAIEVSGAFTLEHSVYLQIGQQFTSQKNADQIIAANILNTDLGPYLFHGQRFH